MTAKEYLNQIRDLDILIDRKQAALDRLRTLSMSISVSVNDNPIQTSGSKDKMGDTVSRIIDVQDEINADIDKLVGMRIEASNLIDQLNKTKEISVLYMRYLEKRSWDEIADELSYSLRRIFEIHGDALHNLEKSAYFRSKICDMM